MQEFGMISIKKNSRSGNFRQLAKQSCRACRSLVAAVGILLTMLGVRDLMGMDGFTLVAKVHRNS